MIKSTIIMKHSPSGGSGGIGDFLRCCISMYTFCKREGLKLYFDFTENKGFGKCFDYEPIPAEIRQKIEDNEHRVIKGIWNKFSAMYTRDVSEHFLYDILASPNVYVIVSNCIGFEDRKDIMENIDEFNEIIKPSKGVLDYMNQLREKHTIKKGEYASVHIRCGDKNMSYMSGINNSID